jgi:DNA-binding IclR family transcriptional regulator
MRHMGDLTTDNGEDDQPAYHLRSVDHALRALVLLDERGVVRGSELAEHLEIGRSTAHRILGTLQYHGFVTQDSATRAYRAGPITLTRVRSEVDYGGLLAAARPYLEALRRQLNETIHLAVLEGNAARFIDGLEGRQVLHIGVRTGMLLPAHCTAVGKALLASLPPAQLSRMYPRPMAGATPKSIVTLQVLQAELRLTRRRGYATNFGESHSSVGAVAVTITSTSQTAVAALAMAAPTERFDRTAVPRIAATLRGTAEAISASLALAAMSVPAAPAGVPIGPAVPAGEAALPDLP